MNARKMPAWLERFDQLLKAPRGARLIAHSTNPDGTVEPLQRLLLARHWLYFPDDGRGDGRGDPVVWFLQIGWDDGPTYQDLSDDYFDESPPRSVNASRARLDDNNDVLFSVPMGDDDDPWAPTVDVRVTACTEVNSWVAGEWDVYCQTLTDEQFHERYVVRITPGHPDGLVPWEPEFRG